MKMRELLKTMAVKICAIANQIFPFVESVTAEGDDYVLVENQDMMIACLVSPDKDGAYRLFVYDQITGNELCVIEHGFVDRRKAIAQARALIYRSASHLVRQWPSDSVTDMQAEGILQKNPVAAIESGHMFLSAKFSPTRFGTRKDEIRNNLQGQH